LNEKVETVSQKSDLTARLGSPKGEKEKGGILKEAVRKAQVVKEPRAAHDRNDDRHQPLVEKEENKEGRHV